MDAQHIFNMIDIINSLFNGSYMIISMLTLSLPCK